MAGAKRGLLLLQQSAGQARRRVGAPLGSDVLEPGRTRLRQVVIVVEGTAQQDVLFHERDQAFHRPLLVAGGRSARVGVKAKLGGAPRLC
jgi:hypothetical protein